MEYAHRMTKDERERHDTLRKAGSLGVFGQRLSQDVLDQYADIVGPVDNHVTPDEAREVAEAYKNEIYKALHK